MPVFEASQIYPRPVEEVFAFFRAPANLVKISSPQLHMRLVEGPAQLELGSRVVLHGRRWGIRQRVLSEITAFEAPVTFTDTQVEGPFRKWTHTHRFEAADGGTRVSDHIEYEPPGGLLGLVVTAGMIERDLKWIFEYRTQKSAELLGG
ncbi:MAG TPA: SRPBCC family protein [Gemmataceae bacterium]|nr:SRPBCC family protein [Gemmataceae bacterium]